MIADMSLTAHPICSNFLVYNLQWGEQVVIGNSVSGNMVITQSPMYAGGSFSVRDNVVLWHLWTFAILNPSLPTRNQLMLLQALLSIRPFRMRQAWSSLSSQLSVFFLPLEPWPWSLHSENTKSSKLPGMLVTMVADRFEWLLTYSPLLSQPNILLLGAHRLHVDLYICHLDDWRAKHRHMLHVTYCIQSWICACPWVRVASAQVHCPITWPLTPCSCP